MSQLSFDDAPRSNKTYDATKRIARILDESGINAKASLYDEALGLARDGHLAAATERLRMLLVLDPSDGDAALLLGKVLASRELWQESLQWLDAATANGAVLPPGLKEKVEASFQRGVDDAEAIRARLATRERGELQSLRGEAKRLRSDNASLEVEVSNLRSRNRVWSSATAILTGVAMALGLALVLFDQITEPAAEEPALPTASVRALIDEASVTAAPIVQATPAAQTTALIATAPTPDATKTAPPEPATRLHRVRRGDTLGRIARDYYGSSADWPRLQKANAQILGETIDLQVGMELVVP